MKFFETKFLDAANKLLSELDPKIVRKVLYNIDLAEQTYDPKLLKKTYARNLGVSNKLQWPSN